MGLYSLMRRMPSSSSSQRLLIIGSFLNNSTLSVRADNVARAPKTEIELTTSTEYKVTPLSSADQGSFSDTYRMDSFSGVAAILKVIDLVNNKDPNIVAKTEREIRFLTKVGAVRTKQTLETDHDDVHLGWATSAFRNGQEEVLPRHEKYPEGLSEERRRDIQVPS